MTDDEKYAIGQALYQAAKLLKAEAMLMTMTAREVSGQEPPAVVAAAMKAADVVICPMKTSITHTRAKIGSWSKDCYNAGNHGGNVCHGCYDCRLQSCYGTYRAGD